MKEITLEFRITVLGRKHRESIYITWKPNLCMGLPLSDRESLRKFLTSLQAGNEYLAQILGRHNSVGRGEMSDFPTGQLPRCPGVMGSRGCRIYGVPPRHRRKNL